MQFGAAMTQTEYPMMLRPLSAEAGGGYLVEFPDLPGCMSAMREAGRPIPAPGADPAEAYSGKLYGCCVRRAPRTVRWRNVPSGRA